MKIAVFSILLLGAVAVSNAYPANESGSSLSHYLDVLKSESEKLITAVQGLPGNLKTGVENAFNSTQDALKLNSQIESLKKAADAALAEASSKLFPASKESAAPKE